MTRVKKLTTPEKKPMARKETSSGRTKAEATPEKDPREIGKKDPYVPKQGYFEFVVLSYTQPIPDQKGYDKKKDQLLNGFQFGGSQIPTWMPTEVTKKSDITAYDFLTNPRTGLRAGQKDPPKGGTVTSLDHGISGWHDIPPLWIWNKGDWLWDLIDTPNNGFDIADLPDYFRNKVKLAADEANGDGTPMDLFPYWVTSGEGTTGNYLYKIFKLPDEIASTTYAKHPALWKKELKKTWYGGTTSGGYGDGLGIGQKALGSGPSTSLYPSQSSDSSLPLGVRIRCGGCGHWFKSSDLPGHAKVCDPTGEADWAMMCCDECGCVNLDQATKPKEGFPRESWKKAHEAAKKKNEEEKKAKAEKEPPIKEGVQVDDPVIAVHTGLGDPSATKKAADKREEGEAKK